VATSHFTERIHAIHTQSEPYVLRIQCKVWVSSISFSPLGSISRVSQDCVFLSFFFVPSHQLSMIFVPKQTLQMWYYRRVPHDLAETLFLGCSPSTSPGSSLLILYLNAPHTEHASKFSYSSPHTGYTHWVMRVSSVPPNLESKQVVLLRMLWQTTRYP
jgi:hypothetical protein